MVSIKSTTATIPRRSTSSRSFAATMIVFFTITFLLHGAARAELLGRWTLDDGLADPASLIAIDSSGNGNDGMLIDFDDSPWISGADAVYGGAIDFESRDGYIAVQIDNIPTENDPRTLAAWIKIPVVDIPVDQGDVKFLSYGTPDTGEAFNFTIQDNRGELAVWQRHFGGNFRYDGAFEDEWMHVAIVVPEGAEFTDEVQVYINGEESIGVQGGGSPQDLITGFSDLYMGASFEGPGDFKFPGQMDDVWLFDEALDADAIIDVMNGEFGGGVVGDFNNNGLLDLPDVNMLNTQIDAATNDVTFDLNADNLVNEPDLTVWVKDLRKTWFGDANLDGEFTSGDLILVLAAGKFESDAEAGWQEGDWDANLRFTTSDIVKSLADGGFQQGPLPAATAAVPEPTGISLCLTALLAALCLTRRKA